MPRRPSLRRFPSHIVLRSRYVQAGLVASLVVLAPELAGGQDKEPHAAWVEKGAPIVTAIHAFEQAHGLWPQSLSELVPEYLATKPEAAWTYTWNIDGDCVLKTTVGGQSRARGRRPVLLAYVFGGEDQGWFVNMSGAYVQLSGAPPAPPSNVSEDEQVRRAVAEFDRRIARAPNDLVQYKAKVSYLYDRNRLDEARAAAIAWATAMPRIFQPRNALADIERKRRAGLARFERSENWAKQAHATYAAWWLFNDPHSNSEHYDRWGDAIRLPFAADQGEWYIAEAAAYDAALSAYEQGNFQQTVTVCNRWEAEARQRAGACDESYLVFRAAAKLALGEVEAARIDLAEAPKQNKEGRVSADHLEALRAAIESSDRAFRYAVENYPYGARDWYIKGVQ